MIATGTLIQKIACQFQPSMIAPPTSGPTATPRPEMPPQMPMASGRRAGATAAAEQGERERHDSRAAEALQRAGRDQLAGVGAERREHRADAEDRDADREHRAAAEAVAERGGDEDRRLANASVYALTNHCSSSTLAPSCECSTGSALVITRLSRVAMNIGRDAAAMTSPKGRRAAGVVVRVSLMRGSCSRL